VARPSAASDGRSLPASSSHSWSASQPGTGAGVTQNRRSGNHRPVSLAEDGADHDPDHQDDDRDAEHDHEPLPGGVVSLAPALGGFLLHRSILARTALVVSGGRGRARRLREPERSVRTVARRGAPKWQQALVVGLCVGRTLRAGLSSPGHGGTAPGALTPGVAAIGRPIRCAIGGKEQCGGSRWPAPARWGRFRSLKSG